jgi:hypothetical protein
MLYVDWLHLFFVAAMGASATLSLKNGALCPFFRDVTRNGAPVKYWSWIAFCGWVVIASVASTLWVALQR